MAVDLTRALLLIVGVGPGIAVREVRRRRRVRWAVMDLSGPYRKAFTDTLAHAKQIADPFHVVKLAAGAPRGEVRDAWHAKETVPMIYRIRDHALAAETLDELSRDLRDEAFPPEPNKLGRTLRTWRDQITNRHRSRVTNGPTGAANNPAKLTKRVSFGITNFDHYRIRALLHAAKPDRSLLDTLTPG
ncbi:ISL3 family transposase [Candidatus Poriferisodalis sp.]|uniref:ISL3 family transposase n=1 Tax=Candidatus Poriferisodalis sp. TaxID=3101277 RepID=UPI003B5983B2